MICITHIRLNRVRNIPVVDIDLSSEERQHLILTGPNGSGKTTLINDIKAYFAELNKNTSFITMAVKEAKIEKISEWTNTPRYELYSSTIQNNEKELSESANVALIIANQQDYYIKYLKNDFVICSFDSSRKVSFIEPKGVSKIQLKHSLNENVGQFFVQLLVNLKAQRSFARDDDNQELIDKIDLWFSNFNNALATLLGHKDFELVFDSVNFNYTIREKNKEPFHFSELSDGYSSLLSIVSELMLRMSLDPLAAYDKEGIVLIDEIENHLHVELQKKVLPFLSEFFPNIQFIVTTHSPFVLSSINNSVIFDMEKCQSFEDFSKYSYNSIIESYFGIDTYSDLAIESVNEVERILNNDALSEEDITFVQKVKKSIEDLPEIQIVSPELRVKLNSLLLNNLSKLNGLF